MSYGVYHDGIDDFGQAANPITGYPFTFECDIFRAKSGASQAIISIAHPTNASIYYALGLDASNRAIIQCANAATRLATGTTVIPTTKTHLAAVFESATSRRLFVNGVEETLSGAPTATATFSTAADRILTGLLRTVTPTWWFGGVIRNVRIWNTARSSYEILWYKDFKLNADEKGLVRYWPYDEGAGTSVDDKVDSATMILTGAVWQAVTEYLSAYSNPFLVGMGLNLDPKKPIVSGLGLFIDPNRPLIAGIALNLSGNNFNLIVKDKLGAAIVGADVKITGESFSVDLVTDGDGFTTTQLATAKSYLLTISKNGKQFYKDIFYMDYERYGIYDWEISLPAQQSLYITPEKAYVNPRPQDPERNILI